VSRPLRLPDPPLRDELVLLRGWREDDVPRLVRACRDPEIARWTRVPSPYTETQAWAWVADQARRLSSGEELDLAVVDAASGALVGAVGLMRFLWEYRRAEIGYWAAKEARRRSVASRAVRLLSGWALAELGIERIELLAQPDNVASQGVAERCGFTREGLLRSYHEIKGRRVNVIMFSLLRTDAAASAATRR
jgi:ribosomal-protein-alanine N-acetyltransferase